MAEVDVLVVGAGVLGRSIAFALASAEPGCRVVLCGRQSAGASEAAGAMLGVLGEVTAASLEKEHSRLRLEMAIEAARRWDGWLDRIGRCGTEDLQAGYGRGTYLLLNTVSGPTDERAFAAISEAGRRYGLPVQDVDPAEVPACRPVYNDRPLRALYLPDEHFLDARRWLAALDAALAALPNVTIAPPGDLTATPAGAYALASSAGEVFQAPTAVIAAGAWSTDLVHRIDPDLPVLPVVIVEGTSVTVSAPAALPAVLRTPNRAYACGLHAVPQADGTWYIGASAVPTPAPTIHPTPGALRFLLDNALSQLDHELADARIHAIHHGNRPVGLDGHPLIGPTSRPGLWVVTGTHRDGLHASPLIAEELTAALLRNTTSSWLEPWAPEREPIADWQRDEAVEEAVAHHAALAAEARMRPPLNGTWPQTLHDAYRHQMAHLYEQLPQGFTLPPDLAPLGYRHGPHLAALLATHLERRQHSTTR